MGRKVETALRIPKYVLVSAAGTVVDTAVLWLVSHHVFHSFAGEYLLSPFISFECAVLFNFICSFFLIWKDRMDIGNARTFMSRYLLYNLSCTMTFLLKMGLLLFFKFLFGWDVVICNLIALCVSGIVNFVMSDRVIFR
ncbi:MAG: GtrA family protein [Bacteroidales bacterium]|nr:GtrA family protein [Bacteroidales bacterium]